MNRGSLSFSIGLILLMLFGCSEKEYSQTERGIILKIQNSSKYNTKLLRVEVLADEIIHVSAVPDRKWPEDTSLVIVSSVEPVPFTVGDQMDSIHINTSKLSVRISKQDGGIRYLTKNGKVLLTEKPGGGRTFVPIEVEDTPGYTIEQIFESPDDEAFYGLGQHQSDEFNYKGKREELFQYNTKISVPFIVSNKNYGLLWDSYSLARFGDSRDYLQLNRAFTLYDKMHRPGSLSGTYQAGENGMQLLVRREDSLYFETVKSVRNLPENFPLKHANVTYEGELEAKQDGVHNFILYYAGYVKVYLDGKLIVPERWRTSWNPNSYKFSFKFTAGERIPIKIMWKPDGGRSYLGLRALPPQSNEEQGNHIWWSEMDKKIDYFFVYGENMDEIIKGYRKLTGKSQIMPKWAMGYWQSRERYKTQEEVLGTITEFRKRKFPIDNIVLDWNHWREDAWGSHEFDLSRFPDPKGMIDSIHALNAQIMISVWPKFYLSTDHFKEFDEKGWMYQLAVKDSIRDWVGPGYIGSFYDAYAEGARKLFWNQINEHYYPLGIDAWWMDASEPNILDCTDMDYRKALSGPTALGPSAEYFNTYALMNAEAIYKGQRSVAPNRRVFLLTRSGFAGIQRYSTATWSGDIGTRWEDMKAQISAGLNFAISGIPYWTMDIGGFCVEDRYVAAQQEYDRSGKVTEDYNEWRELNTRWYQFGAFTPLFRSHGQFPYREPWHIAPEDHPAYQSILYYTQLRYRLMPYIYSLAGMTYFEDYTIMRPLVMDFPQDKTIENIGDQYMFGPSILVAPIYSYGARKREVYLPANSGWYDFHSGIRHSGGSTIEVDAPYEQIPLFIKEGSIIPFGPDLQYAQQPSEEALTILIYRGDDGEFMLYEDEGVNYNYENGQYSMINFKYNESTGLLTIGQRVGQYQGMQESRRFNIVSSEEGVAFKFTGKDQGIQVIYDGTEQSIDLNVSGNN
ncbi:MAG: glycoside hydrolase family 31 protein [Cyclobacteriaceae bacterium]